jgi:type I restriction enzyme S subunit
MKSVDIEAERQDSPRLPTGWKWVTVGEMAETVQYGTSAKTNEDISGVPVIRMGNIQQGALSFESLKYLPPHHYEFPELLLRDGDVLFNRTNSAELVGKSAVYRGNPPRASFASYLIRAQLKESYVPEFLCYYINSPYGRQWVSSVVSQQVGQANVNGTKLKALRIPVPSYFEQRRIVAEIEKQFTRLDAGVAALRRVQANLKRYRAAVLKAACEGRLVPTEAELTRSRCITPGSFHGGTIDSPSHGSNPIESSLFESGEQLLARILTKQRENWTGRGRYKEPIPPDTAKLPTLPEGWTWAMIEQIGKTTTGFTPPKGDASFFGGDIPFFKPSDLDAGYYVQGFRDSLTEAGAEHGRILHPLSILVTCIGATIGKTGLARVRCTTNQQINALSVPVELISAHFVFWFFNSPFGQRQVIDNASATTLPILNKSKFEALAVALPPLAEQKRIVAEVERRLSVIDELETLAAANLTRATRLRQSILQQAFTGRLPIMKSS